MKADPIPIETTERGRRMQATLTKLGLDRAWNRLVGLSKTSAALEYRKIMRRALSRDDTIERFKVEMPDQQTIDSVIDALRQTGADIRVKHSDSVSKYGRSNTLYVIASRGGKDITRVRLSDHVSSVIMDHDSVEIGVDEAVRRAVADLTDE